MLAALLIHIASEKPPSGGWPISEDDYLRAKYPEVEKDDKPKQKWAARSRKKDPPAPVASRAKRAKPTAAPKLKPHPALKPTIRRRKRRAGISRDDEYFLLMM